MILNKLRYSCVFAALTIFVSPAFADNVEVVLNEFRNGDLPVGNSSSSILLPFAWEWDAVSAKVIGPSDLADGEAYDPISRSNEEWLKASVQALTESESAVAFFKAEETMKAFDLTYKAAVDSGSSIGSISREDALRYWMLSRAVAAGPDVITDLPLGEISVQWCLPPLIRCTPRKPLPKQ